jgi:hypothetical protein
LSLVAGYPAHSRHPDSVQASFKNLFVTSVLQALKSPTVSTAH